MNHFLTPPQILGGSSNLAAKAETKTASPVKTTKKTNNKKKNTGNVEKQAVPRKRAGKKDRHSKIYTAQGPRDRRMRLSLQIARKFFDLQDMLGFDKASKTIEWLFSKSKAAIKELAESSPSVKNSCTGGTKSLSSTSESEVVSAIKNPEDNRDQKSALAIAESLVGTSKGVMNRKSRNPIIIYPIVRESRNKARARARERTIEKMKMRGLEKSKVCSEEANPNDLQPLSSPSPLQTAENFSSSSPEKNSPLKVMEEEEEEESGMIHLPEHQMDSVSIIEKFLGIKTSPRSSSIFDYTHNLGESSDANSQQNNPVYAGNWNNVDNDSVQYSYCAITSKKGSTGNLQEQNSGAIFKINPDFQGQNCSSIYMSTDNTNGQNPNSDFKALSDTHDQKPSSLVMTTSNIDPQTNFLEYEFSCNPTADNNYCGLY